MYDEYCIQSRYLPLFSTNCDRYEHVFCINYVWFSNSYDPFDWFNSNTKTGVT